MQFKNRPKTSAEDMNRNFSLSTSRSRRDTHEKMFNVTPHQRNLSKLQWDAASHLSEWLKSTIQETTGIAEDLEKKEHCALLVGMQTNADNVELSMEFPQKGENRTTLWSSNCTTEHLPKEYTDINSKGHMHTYC